MNVFERLAKSAESRHGLELQARQVQELVATMQAMQMQIANDQGRLEAQTRILAVALNQVGGALDIDPSLFAQAEAYIVDVEWSDEGDNIRASLRMADVGVPEVSQDGAAASGSGDGAVPVSADSATGPDSDRPVDEDETEE